MEVVFIIAVLGFVIISYILVGSSGYLKNRTIKRRHQEQFQEIQNHSSNTLHLMPITQIEYGNSINFFGGSGGLFFVLILLGTLCFIFIKKRQYLIQEI